MATTFTKTTEPAYEYEESSLSESEALDRYASEKAQHPNAIVTIDGLDCGEHYGVKVYNSEKEKQSFYRKRLADLIENLLNAVKT